MHQLLSCAVMAIQPLALDVASSARHIHTKLQHDIMKETPANVKQEFMMVPVLSPEPVDLRQTREAMKTAP